MADPEPTSPARIYDYLLGGTTSRKADRDAVDKLLKTVPEIRTGAFANRGFLGRAVRHLAELGIDQFIDLGSGLPTENNTDEVARRVNPDARVVYVDLDPAVTEHLTQLNRDTVTAIQADLRRPCEVLGDPAMEIIDFRRPVAVLLVGVLHFVSDDHDPLGIVRAYLDAVPPGSHLALSHMNATDQPARSVARIEEAWRGTPTGVHLRSRPQIASWFEGLEIVPPYPGRTPELVHIGEWGVEDLVAADTEGSRLGLCAVGRKP